MPLNKIKSMVCNLVKRAFISLPCADDTPFQVAQVSYFGKTANAEIVYPYGICANAPRKSFVLLFNVFAQESNRAGIAYNPKLRKKNLKEGEVAFGNFLADSYIFFDKEGNIQIISTKDVSVTCKNATVTAEESVKLAAPQVTIESPNITLNGNVELNGNLEGTGDFNFGGSGAVPIARVGDTVVVDTGTGVGEITTGSAVSKTV